jgi:hypothetical protein
MCSTLLYSSYGIRHALHIAIFSKGKLEVQVLVFVLSIEDITCQQCRCIKFIFKSLCLVHCREFMFMFEIHGMKQANH